MENIIIAGRGKTSRANIEALMEDHYYANKNVNVYVVSNDALTDSLTWAHQHAEDMRIACLIEEGVAETFAGLASTDTSVFLVWSDDDVECQESLGIATENNWPVYDLTNGLIQIQGAPNAPKVVEPIMPPEEVIVEEEYEEEDDETSSDPLYDAIGVIADLIAEAVFERLSDMQKRKR
jgi:CO dehydrogenase nickel-insertion accessory protein CooC1